MIRFIHLVILLLCLPITASAQTDSTSICEPLPLLSSEYYSGVSFLKQNYNYELVNKKRSLKTRSSDMYLLSAMMGTGALFAFDFITMDNGWSEAIVIPCSAVVGVAVAAPFFYLGSHFHKKSEAIQVETAYMLPLGRHTDIGPAMFSNYGSHKCEAIGIGFKTSF
ncbi:MAG: hypothetical protein J5486_06050 [Bacteroidaceae bacterium]|nr:hypothetical protein [Bacteroidaceae bacterium]